MALLALDTSSINCSVHAKRSDGVVSERILEIGRGHAEHIIGMIDQVLDAIDLAYQDITRIGVTVGPGSFTGVRVGLSVARGLGLALDIPVIGISSLQALAADHKVDGAKLVILDAKRNEFYAQLFDDTGTPVSGPFLQRGCEAVPPVWLAQKRLFIIGSGAKAFEHIGSNTEILSTVAAPKISTVARLAENAQDQGVKPKPLYVRPPDAKPQPESAQIERVPS